MRIENVGDLLVVVINFEGTETFLASGQQLDWIFSAAFAAFETLDEAHKREVTFLYSLDKGQKKKPRAKQARGFF